MPPESELRCLLVSPIEPFDPISGDIVYTHTLLDTPPPGIDYRDYASAMQTGELIDAHRLRRMVTGHWHATDNISMAALRFGLNKVRRSGFLLPEPWMFLRVAGHFDLVHIHCFPVRLEPKSLPVVLSDSIGSEPYLRNVRGYDARRVAAFYRRERRLLHLFGTHHTTVGVDRAQKLIVFSEFGKSQYLRRGVPEHKIAIVPPGIAEPDYTGRVADGVVRFLFIATDFALKGGDTLLLAWRKVRSVRTNVTLTVLGKVITDPPEGVMSLPYLPRE